MPELWSNNATSTLGASINTSVTTVTVATGDGSKFPSPSGGDYFYATIQEGATIEIVEVTARSGDSLTVVRARQSTTAASFTTAAKIENRLTKDALVQLQFRGLNNVPKDGSEDASKFRLVGVADETQMELMPVDGSQLSPVFATGNGTSQTLQIYPDGTLLMLGTVNGVDVLGHANSSLIHQNIYQVWGAQALRL